MFFLQCEIMSKFRAIFTRNLRKFLLNYCTKFVQKIGLETLTFSEKNFRSGNNRIFHIFDQGTVVNRATPSLYEESLEITRTVPLT